MIKQIPRTTADQDLLAKLPVTPGDIADDHFDYSRVVVKKPWGYEYLIFQNDSVAVWVLYLQKGAETSMHCHPSKKTSLIVLQGKVLCSTLESRFERSTGEGLLIDKGVFHQTRVLSDDGAFVMEIETPVNKRDLVRSMDKYGRQGKGYESSASYSKNIQNYNYISFSGPNVHYNLKKRFGQCTITFKRITTSVDLSEILALEDEDVISVLRGHIADQAGKPVIEFGDTMTVRDLRAVKGLKPGDSLELLMVKKIDKIIKVSDYVVDFFKSQKVKSVFLVPGDANVHLLDSIGRDESLGFVCNQLERGASMAAEAYGKLTGEPGFLLISSGASGPNALPGVSNAWIDSTPLFVISGQARTDQDTDGKVRQLGNKSLDIVELVKPLTKYAVKVTDPMTIRYHLEKAAYHAKEGRMGPVWVDIPIDIQGMTIGETELQSFVPPASPVEPRLVDKQVQEALQLLRTAERPVLLVGNGVRLSKAEAELMELIDKLGIPVLTSRRGADLLSEDHPLFFGRPGMYGHRRANFIIQNSDLLISIGSRLSIPLIGRNTMAFARAAKKVIADIDADELQKSTLKADVAIRGDAKTVIKGFLTHLPEGRGGYSAWIQRCKKWASDFPTLKEGYKHDDLINPYLFVNSLSEQLKENDVLVADGGLAMSYTMQSFKFKKGQRLISSTGLELPGFAVSGSIGASVGMGRRQVVCLCEDRGFQVSIQELQTISDNKLPIKIFLLKNKGHSTVRTIQKDFFGGRYVGTDNEILFGSYDLAKIASIYGFLTYEISDPASIDAQIQRVLASEGPTVCEIQTDSGQELIPRMGFTVKGDGKWLAKPLEDMYPFLERKALKEQMIIDLLEED